ncbi:MAG: hypothetical protein HKN48_07660 [Flavobacteriaceae bacterium]|nr:hypothetical protein [Flavobacteriaceae bacterium]
MIKAKSAYYFLIAGLVFGLGGCKDDDSRSCTTCDSPETLSFEVCRESNGNASVNGQDTETNYDLYIADLEEAGANCSGG